MQLPFHTCQALILRRDFGIEGRYVILDCCRTFRPQSRHLSPGGKFLQVLERAGRCWPDLRQGLTNTSSDYPLHLRGIGEQRRQVSHLRCRATWPIDAHRTAVRVCAPRVPG